MCTDLRFQHQKIAGDRYEHGGEDVSQRKYGFPRKFNNQ